MTVDRLAVTPPAAYDAEWSAKLATMNSLRPQDFLQLVAGDVVVVVGAHPDDETFGVGASIASLSQAGVEVHALSLSSGEAALDQVRRSAVGSRAAADLRGAAGPGSAPGLGARRAREYQRACEALGVASSTVLDLPDSRLGEHPRALRLAVSELVERVRPIHLLTVWWSDPHPDHRAVGEASVAAARAAGCQVSGYPVWAPHWLDPASELVEWRRLQPMVNDASARQSHDVAISCYRSQIEPLAADLEPVLPPSFVHWTTEILVRA